MCIPFISVSFKMLSVSLNLGWRVCSLMQVLYPLILQTIIPTQRSSYICYTTLLNGVLPSGPTQWHIFSIPFYSIHTQSLQSPPWDWCQSLCTSKGAELKFSETADSFPSACSQFLVCSYEGQKAADRITAFVSTLSQYSEGFTNVFLSNL